MESTTTSSTSDANGTTVQKPNGNIIKPHKDTAPSLFPKLDSVQLVILTVYPITVLLGVLSNHPADSYFSRKDNFINIYFLKFGWLWTSVAFFAHIASVPQTVGPFVRYITATVWWYLVTQWCFGPPIMDKVASLVFNFDDRCFVGLEEFVSWLRRRNSLGCSLLRCVERVVELGVEATIW